MRISRNRTKANRTKANRTNAILSSLLAAILLCGGSAAVAQANSDSHPGAGKILVHSKFGGQIFGFDIDQNGAEGVLSEALLQSNGTVLAAVETFNQKTGDILKVVQETQTQDDFVTLGVVGNSVGSLVWHLQEIK